MFLEYWQLGMILAWWLVSIHYITRNDRKKHYGDGMSFGVETTIKVLEMNNIITIEGEEISPFSDKNERFS
jgi:hypothetical protein|tara:strand:+ start:1851 stop:2063 length:213 start_codon:yes stop_codon:yes gene_type:complete